MTSVGPARPVRRPASGQRAIDRLRRTCLAMPGAVERLSHGEPTWFAGEKGKVFATLDDHHHNSAHVSVWLPVPLGRADELIDQDPERYFRPAYVGGKGWVAVVLDGKPDWKAVERLVGEAWGRVGNGRR